MASPAISNKPIAIIGSIDTNRADFDPPLKNSHQARDAGRALGRALAEAGHPILVFSSSPIFLEAFIVEGYVGSGKAKPDSIIMLYPRQRDPAIHGDFVEQATHAALFDPRTDTRPRWEASYYQCLPGVTGVLMVGGGRATLIMGVMALANKVLIVSLATFGASGEEIWAMLNDKPWIDAADRQEMGRGTWSDDRAASLVASFERQRIKLDAIKNEQEMAEAKHELDRKKRSQRALVFGSIATVFTLLGVFGSPASFGQRLWPVLYALCFAMIPICAGMAGAMFYTLRRAQHGRHRYKKPPHMVSGPVWAPRSYFSFRRSPQTGTYQTSRKPLSKVSAGLISCFSSALRSPS